jgi:hypothetical protein
MQDYKQVGSFICGSCKERVLVIQHLSGPISFKGCKCEQTVSKKCCENCYYSDMTIGYCRVWDKLFSSIIDNWRHNKNWNTEEDSCTKHEFKNKESKRC